MLLNIKFIDEWEAIRLRKQKHVDANTTRENRLRVDHDYTVEDKVLTTDKEIHKKLNCHTKGPIKYQTEIIYVLNIIGLFFQYLIFIYPMHTTIPRTPVVTLN